MHTANHAVLADQFADARDGLTLVAVIPAGIPVTTLKVDVDAQEEKELPLLTESTLRLIQAGVTAPNDISGLLGFPADPVRRTLSEGLVKGHIRLNPNSPPDDEHVRLTPLGQQVALEHAAIRPVRERMTFYYDGTLGDIQPYDRTLLIQAREAADEDLLKLPAITTAPVRADDLTPDKLNSLLRAEADNRYTVLAVRDVRHPPTPRYLPADLLVYSDPDRKDIEVAVVIDGKISTPHELALISRGGANALGIRVDPPAERPRLDDDLERIRIPVSTKRDNTASHASPKDGVAEQGQVLGVSVFDHPRLLEEAITQARARLLIVSPWIKNSVVNDTFIAKLEGRIRRGVRVNIAYGFSRHDKKCDPEAVRRLEDLATRYPNDFSFTRLKSTHAKVLIYDDTCITTSFNWLSFQGAQDRTYRMEEGNLVTILSFTDTQYAYFLNRIAEQRMD
ncbi:phospholipase D-like domain-containing protein [Streptomyces sp. RB6PN25]|uniref:Phospholipase D-like domain-containing protein n=1 Tax=Streptomyces humicola TaxID=2953240 RepID=A0ABT1PSX5_9ACTN|nr:phospholipase D-like domain-containing protein [Streptomyces humicola]MCQ4080775.1 phospholipase D-like domain-containing protein [Streptomyces humicola]